jgi:hypothetical protein
MRSAARERAAQFTWEQVIELLLEKVRFIGEASGALPRRLRVTEKKTHRFVQDRVVAKV